MNKGEEKLIVALDVPRLEEAERLVRLLAPVVETFKIGMELFTAEGPRAIRMVHSHKARVFLDLSFMISPTRSVRPARPRRDLGSSC